jgi:hypothetical protein
MTAPAGRRQEEESMKMNEKELRQEHERGALIVRNLKRRCGGNMKLVRRALAEILKTDERLQEAAIDAMAKLGIEEAAKAGIITCFPDGTFKMGPNEIVEMPNGQFLVRPRR